MSDPKRLAERVGQWIKEDEDEMAYLRARIAKLEALNAMMIQALKRGCSCRPGGGTCPCCLALDHADGKEWG